MSYKLNKSQNEPAFKKGDELELVIHDIGQDGAGIGKIDGYTLFVKDACPGDRILAKIMKVKSSYGYARLQVILEPSFCRVKPKCPYAARCGGCQIQHIDYKEQLVFKERMVLGALRHIGGIELSDGEFEGITGMDEPYHYRNKAQYPIGKNSLGLPIAGFYAGRTHSIIDICGCILSDKRDELVLDIVLNFMRETHVAPYDEHNGSGIIRHVFIRTSKYTGEILVCLVINADKLPKSDILVERLKTISGISGICININEKKTNVILGEKTKVIWGRGYIVEKIKDTKYNISVNSFFQVNSLMTAHLYEKIAEYVQMALNNKGYDSRMKCHIWDIYCGIGTIGLYLAGYFPDAVITGIESVKSAVKDAQKNALLNGVSEANYCAGRAESLIPDLFAKKGESADIVIVDPPRKGCEKSLLEAIAQISPDALVYVSCDPATLARDLKYLKELGFEINKMSCFDQFAQTVHVETVCLLSRNK